MLKKFAAACLALGLAAACNQGGKTFTPVAGDSFLGPADAAVTVIEFGAPTCPACKSWHDAVWAQLKTTYIDTGKVKFVFRELPSHNPPVDSAIASIARCSGNDTYFKVLDEAFKRHAEIETASHGATGPRPALVSLGAKFGMSAEQVEACIRDPANIARIQQVQADANARGVNGTPTFFVNDRMVNDARFDALSSEIEAALAASAPAPQPAPEPAPAQ